jgi:hypothetical protein
MAERIIISNSVAQAAGSLLDYLMNDPVQTESMAHWVRARMIHLGHDPMVASDEANEGAPAYNLYFTLTAEYHARVLAAAMLGLTNDQARSQIDDPLGDHHGRNE